MGEEIRDGKRVIRVKAGELIGVIPEDAEVIFEDVFMSPLHLGDTKIVDVQLREAPPMPETPMSASVEWPAWFDDLLRRSK